MALSHMGVSRAVAFYPRTTYRLVWPALYRFHSYAHVSAPGISGDVTAKRISSTQNDDDLAVRELVKISHGHFRNRQLTVTQHYVKSPESQISNTPLGPSLRCGIDFKVCSNELCNS